MSYLTPEQVDAAVKTGKVFFDFKLNPVEPKPGQWFCEFHLVVPEDSTFPAYVQDEALVRYEGVEEHHGVPLCVSESGRRQVYVVWDEAGDDFREPRGEVLILQC